ncbi:MAG TPA: alpha/beta fold hydrolase [Herpetosiphonaceae bacterium]
MTVRATPQHLSHGREPHTAARQRVGAVIVHGFTSDHRAVEPLRQLAHQAGIVAETPLLRGHGGHYRDLRGTRWQHWVADVATARERLEQRVEKVVLMGFSMGGLLALASAAERPEHIAAIVALAPAVRIAHPLAPIAWMARGWMPYVPMGKAVAYSDPTLAVGDDSYHRLAVDAFCSFYYATRRVERMLPRITAPIFVAHSRRDRVIRPQASQIVYDRVKSTDKHLVWFERSGHALLDDCDSSAVLEHVQRFLQTRLEAYIEPKTKS